MGKKAKYKMSIDTINTEGLIIPISKKEFQRQIKHYKKVITENHERHKEEIEEQKVRYPNDWRYSEIEGCLENIDITKEEYEKYTETTYRITDDGNHILFIETVCKPGYVFKV